MAISTAATVASTGIGAIGGIYKFFEGTKMQRDAQKAIQEFNYQSLQNPYATQQVSTLGADLRKEQADLAASQDVAALREAGTRGLVSGLGRVEAQRNVTNRDIAANLDEQQKQINMAKAAQDVANQNIIEQRQNNQLQGYGQLMSTGFGTKYQGIGDITNSIWAGGQGIAGMEQQPNPQVAEVNQLTPQGTITPQNVAPTVQLPKLNPYGPTPDWMDALSKFKPF